MRRMTFGLLVLLFAALPAKADSKRMVGKWLVTVGDDRFGDGGRVVAIMTDDYKAFAVRCIQHKPSLVIGELRPGRGTLGEGDMFVVKFRSDKRDVITTLGEAINDSGIEVGVTGDMWPQIAKAREVAFRVTSKADVVEDWVFKIGGSDNAFAAVFKECPIQ